jgi:hypothetical protein
MPGSAASVWSNANAPQPRFLMDAGLYLHYASVPMNRRRQMHRRGLCVSTPPRAPRHVYNRRWLP